MNVVPYEETYREALRYICVETSYAKGDPREEAFVLALYCDSYLDFGRNYVLVDEAGEAQGYILCAPDYSAYQVWRREFRKKMDLVHRLHADLENLGYALFSKKYPAHLHIDILEPFTGKGSGSMLMDTLLKDLQKQGIPGVMLQVGAENSRGIAFYKKQGFQVLRAGKMGLIMGRRL